jgi:hypothetical protein
MALYDAFLDLPIASAATEFAAIRLGEHRRDFLGKANDGGPAFLLQDASPATYWPAIQLRYLSVQFHTTCRVTTDGHTHESQFAVVSCDGSVPELHEIFVRCFAAAVEQLPVDAGTSELQKHVQGVLDVFRSLTRPSGRQLSGLWAELFVISKSKNVVLALHAWHAGYYERFDFSWPGACLEVKAATGEQRQHEFALEQLQAPVGGKGYVVSVLLQPLTGGVGVIELATLIERELAGEPALREKLWKNITDALGSEFSERLDKRFDASYAGRSLAIYAMQDVPAPERPRDPRVAALRFRVDLSTVQSSLPAGTSSALFVFA